MALSRKLDELPSDAILISRDEVVRYQWKFIGEWTPSSDVWPLRFGFAILGTTSGIAAFLINNHFRHKLRLGPYGRMSSYLPCVAMPTMMATFFHNEFVTSGVLLQNECPTCLEIRAASLQTSLSTIYPLLTAPLAAFNFALRYNTYRLPSITEKPIEVLKLWIKLIKPIRYPLYYNLAFQTILAMGLTYLEGRSFHNLQEKMLILEKQYDNDNLVS